MSLICLRQVLAVICIILWRQYDLNFGGEGQAGKDRYMGNYTRLDRTQ